MLVIIVAALIGGGVWYFTNSHKTDENLVMAEKYMDRGDFDKALEIQPDYPWALSQRGELHRLAGDLDKALDVEAMTRGGLL